jgi:flagellar motor switch protein FliM
MADQILSQEEIDALLSAMDSGEIDVVEEKAGGGRRSPTV